MGSCADLWTTTYRQVIGKLASELYRNGPQTLGFQRNARTEQENTNELPVQQERANDRQQASKRGVALLGRRSPAWGMHGNGMGSTETETGRPESIPRGQAGAYGTARSLREVKESEAQRHVRARLPFAVDRTTPN